MYSNAATNVSDELEQMVQGEFESAVEATLFYKMHPEDTLKWQPFVKRKGGRGYELISEDQPPYNKKMKIGKTRSKEDQTSTGKTRRTTRTKKLCDLEREQKGTEETWVDPHDWTLQTQSQTKLTDNEFSGPDDVGSDYQRLQRQSSAQEEK